MLAPNAKLRPEIIPGRPATANDAADDPDGARHHACSACMSWARLLKRVFNIDVEHCPHCGGKLKIIAAIEEPGVIAKILAHFGLPTRHLRCACRTAQSLLRLQSSHDIRVMSFTAPSPPLTPASLAVQPSHPGLSFAA
jgi:hypothetical protein